MPAPPATRTPRSEPKFEGVHPILAERVARVLVAMDLMGHPMRVTDGVRTQREQEILYAQGRTSPGKIVTNCDGIDTPSPHQVRADGYGHAVDCTFVNTEGKPVWRESDPWALYGLMVQTLKLDWGGAWTHPDRPHVEWV